MTATEKPRQDGDLDRGTGKIQFNFTLPPSERQEIRRQAAELAAILTDLSQQYPLFFYEPPANDPDLDIDAGFKSFGKREVVL